MPCRVAQLIESPINSQSDCFPRGREFDPSPAFTFVEIDHQNFSLIREGLLSVGSRVRKQPIITLYFESENELKFYYLGTRMNTVLSETT